MAASASLGDCTLMITTEVRAKSIDMYGVAFESTAFDRSGTEEVTISLTVRNTREGAGHPSSWQSWRVGIVFLEKVGTSNQVFKLGVSHMGHDLSDFFVDKNEVHYMLGCAGELPTEFFLVRSHSDMARREKNYVCVDLCVRKFMCARYH